MSNNNGRNSTQPYECAYKTTIIASEVGDYSIFVKKNLSGWNFIWLTTKKAPRWFQVKEVIPSPSGSMLYFESLIKDVFKKGCIYPIRYCKETTFETTSIEKWLHITNKINKDFYKYYFREK